MLSDTFKLWSQTRATLLEADSARLAMGVALGMMIGLIPKDSLLAYAIIVILMVSTANLLCATIAGFVFSWVGFFIDSFTHKLGGIILTAETLELHWAYLYDLPFMPWTRFNNTVVMGSFVLSLTLFYPVFRISFKLFQSYGASIHDRIRPTLLYRWLVAPTVPVQNAAVGSEDA